MLVSSAALAIFSQPFERNGRGALRARHLLTTRIFTLHEPESLPKLSFLHDVMTIAVLYCPCQLETLNPETLNKGVVGSVAVQASSWLQEPNTPKLQQKQSLEDMGYIGFQL